MIIQANDIAPDQMGHTGMEIEEEEKRVETKTKRQPKPKPKLNSDSEPELPGEEKPVVFELNSEFLALQSTNVSSEALETIERQSKEIEQLKQEASDLKEEAKILREENEKIKTENFTFKITIESLEKSQCELQTDVKKMMAMLEKLNLEYDKKKERERRSYKRERKKEPERRNFKKSKRRGRRRIVWNESESERDRTRKSRDKKRFPS